MDSTAKVQVPSVLLVPKWVTTANMNSTVVADNFVPASAAVRGLLRERLHRRRDLPLNPERTPLVRGAGDPARTPDGVIRQGCDRERR